MKVALKLLQRDRVKFRKYLDQIINLIEDKKTKTAINQSFDIYEQVLSGYEKFFKIYPNLEKPSYIS